MPNTDFTQTALELFDDISNIVKNQESYVDRWGDAVSRYYLRDIQDNEVIVVDRTNGYRCYGCSFTIDGDKPVIDFSSCKRKKLRYEDYEDGQTEPENSFNFGTHINEIETIAYQKVQEIQEKLDATIQEKELIETNYTAVKSEIDEIKPKYEQYVTDEKLRKEKEIKEQKELIFTRYEKALEGVTKFTELKEKMDETSVDDIRNTCAILYSDLTLGQQQNFSRNNGGNMASVIPLGNDGNNSHEGYVSTPYGEIKISR